jgi:hypothetical protein
MTRPPQGCVVTGYRIGEPTKVVASSDVVPTIPVGAGDP